MVSARAAGVRPGALLQGLDDGREPNPRHEPALRSYVERRSPMGIASAPVHDLDPPLRELLVRRWFKQLRPSAEGESFAEGLIGHLSENAWLEPLSVNPLLLTGMCIVYDEGGRLPQDKHDMLHAHRQHRAQQPIPG